MTLVETKNRRGEKKSKIFSPGEVDGENSSNFYLSPSDYHKHLMAIEKPLLHFRPGMDIKQWKCNLKEKLSSCIGIIPQQKCSLNAQTLWKKNNEYGSIEKVIFASEPFSDIPAYVCIPKNCKPPYTFVICLQGHTSGMHHSIARQCDEKTPSDEKSSDHDFAIGCLKRGLAAICIEQRSFGERRELKQQAISPHGCHDAAMHALMLGRTLAGERVWDVERTIDYLETRSDVEMNKIGIMGSSGGGTTLMYACALLDRIAFAMPACSFCLYRDSIMSIYHCADNYLPGLLRYAEMSDIMGLFAPRPLTVVAGKKDPVFPIDAVKKAFAELRIIYSAYNKPENCKLVIGEEGHRFYADKSWPIMLKMTAMLLS